MLRRFCDQNVVAVETPVAFYRLDVRRGGRRRSHRDLMQLTLAVVSVLRPWR